MSQILYIVKPRKKNEPSYITKNTKFMKTKSFFSLVLIAMSFTLMSFSPADNENTDWSKYELKGKVKELTINTYNAHRYFGVVEKLDNTPLTRVVKFSSDGKILEENGTIISGLKERILYEYTKNQTTISRYVNHDLIQREIIEFNDFGKIKAITYYNSADSKGERTEYVYNDKKQLVTIIFPNQSKTEYEYDQNGMVGLTNSYSSSGVLYWIIRYYYDEKGSMNKNECTNYYSSENSYTLLTYTPEGFPEMRNTYYSKDNQLKSSNTYSYRFDTKGNYTKKSSSEITYSEGKEEETCSIEERTIVYY